MAEKGDSYRPVNQKKWDDNWQLAFGKKKGKKNERSSTGKTDKRRGSSAKIENIGEGTKFEKPHIIVPTQAKARYCTDALVSLLKHSR